MQQFETCMCLINEIRSYAYAMEVNTAAQVRQRRMKIVSLHLTFPLHNHLGYKVV